MIKRILVGLDGSEQSKIAGKYGIYLSKKLKKPVIGIHIIDIRLLEGPFIEDIAGALGFTVYSDFTPKIKEALEKRADIILDAFAKECREEGADCSIVSAYGIVVNEIVNMADPEDLIIVGKKGQHSEFTALLLGSTSEAIARKAPCPVMVTHEIFKEIQNIVLAFDGREKSIHASQYISDTLKDLDIKKVTVISVLEEDSPEKKKHIQELLEEYLKVDFELKFMYGYPEEEITEFINSNLDKYDLLVMGAYGESKIKELILGSTTSYILNHTQIATLLVK
ncbi:MAG: universal stress protein [Aquificae bacterium]|nr:universal stress protein [Aquificota bacterium]